MFDHVKLPDGWKFLESNIENDVAFLSTGDLINPGGWRITKTPLNCYQTDCPDHNPAATLELLVEEIVNKYDDWPEKDETETELQELRKLKQDLIHIIPEDMINFDNCNDCIVEAVRGLVERSDGEDRTVNKLFKELESAKKNIALNEKIINSLNIGIENRELHFRAPICDALGILLTSSNKTILESLAEAIDDTTKDESIEALENALKNKESEAKEVEHKLWRTEKNFRKSLALNDVLRQQITNLQDSYADRVSITNQYRYIELDEVE